mmetsp:Transcript_27422/g.69085  ORF Transcript_27422/g.69085 Transcript_27422/m.69085 type:complete len:223 (+) Transcript_27422:428-1096(+)
MTVGTSSRGRAFAPSSNAPRCPAPSAPLAMRWWECRTAARPSARARRAQQACQRVALKGGSRLCGPPRPMPRQADPPRHPAGPSHPSRGHPPLRRRPAPEPRRAGQRSAAVRECLGPLGRPVVGRAGRTGRPLTAQAPREALTLARRLPQCSSHLQAGQSRVRRGAQVLPPLARWPPRCPPCTWRWMRHPLQRWPRSCSSSQDICTVHPPFSRLTSATSTSA